MLNCSFCLIHVKHPLLIYKNQIQWYNNSNAMVQYSWRTSNFTNWWCHILKKLNKIITCSNIQTYSTLTPPPQKKGGVYLWALLQNKFVFSCNNLPEDKLGCMFCRISDTLQRIANKWTDTKSNVLLFRVFSFLFFFCAKCHLHNYSA